MGLVYMKMVELREDIFQVICFFTYVYDSMYTCLFRRISRHRFRCGCVTGVMFCDKRIYIEQTLYILSNVTFWGNILTVLASFIGVCLEPIYTYTLRDVRRCMILIFTDAFTAMKARPFVQQKYIRKQARQKSDMASIQKVNDLFFFKFSCTCILYMFLVGVYCDPRKMRKSVGIRFIKLIKTLQTYNNIPRDRESVVRAP